MKNKFLKYIIMILVTALFFSCGTSDPGTIGNLLLKKQKPVKKSPFDLFENKIQTKSQLIQEMDEQEMSNITVTLNNEEDSLGMTADEPAVSAEYTLNEEYLTPQQMHQLLKKGLYKKIINSKIDNKSYLAKFYLGIANYCVAEQTSGNKKKIYVDKAEALFKEVGINTTSKNLKAKSVLWHGITMYHFKAYSLSTENLLKPFRYIRKNFVYSRYYNDAIFYSGLVMLKKKNLNETEKAMLQLNETISSDMIYDADYKKWVKPQIAASHYLKKIGRTSGKSSVSITEDKEEQEIFLSPAKTTKEMITDDAFIQPTEDEETVAEEAIAEIKEENNEIKDETVTLETTEEPLLETTEEAIDETPLKAVVETTETNSTNETSVPFDNSTDSDSSLEDEESIFDDF